MNDVFSIKGFDFPKGFLWGSATAGHQIEGDNIHSNYWYNEQKGLAANPALETSGKACNSYVMYEEDSRLLAELGHQVYRMSVEWARIEPEEGTFVSAEVDHYIKVFESVKAKGIKICVTLVHFTVPQWFAAKKGFTEMDNLKYFQRYVEYIVPKIAAYVDMWCVLNEVNMATWQEGFVSKRNTVLYHARAYHIIKKYSRSPVSTAHGFIRMFGVRQGDKFDRTLESYYDLLCNEYFFHAIRTGEVIVPGLDAVYDKEIKDTCDYWAVNTYVRRMVDSRKEEGKGEVYPFSEVKMLNSKFYCKQFDAECLIHNLTRLTDKPVYITENGVSCDDDGFRIVWLVEYLCALHECIEMGVDVRGYMYWSLLDNYEWGSYVPRFGLVDVDREHGFKRTIKPSGYFYREIIENNGYKPEMLTKYLTALPRVKY